MFSSESVNSVCLFFARLLGKLWMDYISVVI